MHCQLREQISKTYAGLDHHYAARQIEVQHPRHARHVDHQTAGMGIGAAGIHGAATAHIHRCRVGGRLFDHLDHFFGVARLGGEFRLARRHHRAVATVIQQVDRIGVERNATEVARQGL